MTRRCGLDITYRNFVKKKTKPKQSTRPKFRASKKLDMDKEVKCNLIVTFVLLTLMCTSTGFLLSSTPCVAPPPCSCWFSSVRCDSRSLKHVPTFSPISSKEYTSFFTVNLLNNQITTIGNNAFKNLSSVNATNIELQLFNNSIESIAPNAFAGIENNIYRIYLNQNNLTTIPAALGKLHNLQYLYIHKNPINSLDSSVMSHIGQNLRSLSIDMQQFQSWPSSLNMLTHLETLIIGYLPFNYLPNDAYDGMSATLTSLTIAYSKLFSIPPAICHLHNLKYFYLEGNILLETNASNFKPCSQKLLQLITLSLQNDSLSNFPDFLINFPSLTNLFLSNNNISSIPSSAVLSLPHLHSFYLEDNDIKCSCGMSSLKGWNVENIKNFVGYCNNQRHVPIKQYIMTSLPQCP